jgi:hypothetical protein
MLVTLGRQDATERLGTLLVDGRVVHTRENRPKGVELDRKRATYLWYG